MQLSICSQSVRALAVHNVLFGTSADRLTIACTLQKSPPLAVETAAAELRNFVSAPDCRELSVASSSVSCVAAAPELVRLSRFLVRLSTLFCMTRLAHPLTLHQETLSRADTAAPRYTICISKPIVTQQHSGVDRALQHTSGKLRPNLRSRQGHSGCQEGQHAARAPGCHCTPEHFC